LGRAEGGTTLPADRLLLGCFFRLRGLILGFCRGVILIVTRYGFRNLFGGKPAVILRV
jgi:hypothetical protein